MLVGDQRSLPLIGLIISIFLIILYFLIYQVEGNFCVIILYCLLPLFVNTSLYILSNVILNNGYRNYSSL
nr:hypothetical protein PEC69_12670 [Staphylococcus aureus]